VVLQPRAAALREIVMLGHALVQLRALLIALAGVLLAWLWIHGAGPLVIVPPLFAFLVGWGLDWIGRTLLLPKHPVWAVRFLEWWILLPASIAAAAGALVVIVAISLAAPDKAAESTKALLAALAAGLTAFLTGSFISWAGDDKDSSLAEHLAGAFQAKYKTTGGAAAAPDVHYFTPGSAGQLWVYANAVGGVEGWGRGARSTRAAGIAEELRTRGSD
jgi:hypothetical protein